MLIQSSLGLRDYSMLMWRVGDNDAWCEKYLASIIAERQAEDEPFIDIDALIGCLPCYN